MTPEPDSFPTVDSFLQDQLEMYERASSKLRDLRTRNTKNANFRRIEPSYNVGDFVLVHRDRWPQRKLKRVESQWFGPFQILEVRHSSLKVRVSPTLGGEAIVSLQHVKHWRVVVDHDLEISGPNSLKPENVVSDDEEEIEEITGVSSKVEAAGLPLVGSPPRGPPLGFPPLGVPPLRGPPLEDSSTI